MRHSMRRLVIVTTVALASMTGGLVLGTVGAQQARAPQGGIDAARQLRCAEGEPVYYAHPPTYPSEEAIPTYESGEAALQEYLGDLGPPIPAQAFERFAEAAAQVQFVAHTPGGIKASAFTRKLPGGWTAETLVACSSFIPEEEQ